MGHPRSHTGADKSRRMMGPPGALEVLTTCVVVAFAALLHPLVVVSLVTEVESPDLSLVSEVESPDLGEEGSSSKETRDAKRGSRYSSLRRKETFLNCIPRPNT